MMPPTDYNNNNEFHQFDNQVIWKLGTIQSEVRNLSDNLIGSIERLEKKIEETSVRAKVDLARIEADVMTNKKEIDTLREWKNTITTRIGFIVSGVSVFWLVFGQGIETTISAMF